MNEDKLTNQIEDTIENGTPDQVQNIVQNAPEPIANEAKQTLDNNPRNDEVNTAKIGGFLSKADYIKDLKKRLPKEPKLFDSLLRDIDVDSYEQGKVFDFDESDNPDPTLLDLKNKYPDLKYKDVSSTPEVYKYYTETSSKRKNRHKKKGYEPIRESISGSTREDLAKDFWGIYSDNFEKYTKEALEKAIENKPEQVLEDPKMPEEAKKEASQVLDTKTNNDEANNQQVEKATNRLSDDFETVDDLMSYLENEYEPAEEPDSKTFDEARQPYYDVDPVNKETDSTEQTPEGTESIVDEAIEGTSSSENEDSKVLEDYIESKPEEAAEDFKGTEVEKEANQILNDTDDRNDEVNDKKIGKFLEKNKGLIDWDKVKVYEPGEDPYHKVSDEADWINNPTYGEETVDDIIDDVIEPTDTDVVDYGLEDQNQYQEGVDPSLDETVYDKTMAETAPISDDKLEPAPEAPFADNVVQIKEDPIDEVVDEVVENDEAQQETEEGRELHLPGLSGTSKSVGSVVSVPVSNTPALDNRLSGAGGSFGNVFRSINAPHGSFSTSPVSSANPASAAPSQSMASRAGGGAKPVLKDAAKAVTLPHTGTPNTGFKTSAGTYRSAGVERTRSRLGSAGAKLPPYGTGSKAAPSKISLTGHKETGDLGLDKLMQLIITASKTWKNPKDSDGLYAPYRIIIQGKAVYVNHMLLQTFAVKHPEAVQDLTNKINGAA